MIIVVFCNLRITVSIFKFSSSTVLMCFTSHENKPVEHQHPQSASRGLIQTRTLHILQVPDTGFGMCHAESTSQELSILRDQVLELSKTLIFFSSNQFCTKTEQPLCFPCSFFFSKLFFFSFCIIEEYLFYTSHTYMCMQLYIQVNPAFIKHILSIFIFLI